MNAAAEALSHVEDELAVRSVDLLYAREPALARAYGPRGRAKCVADARFHVRFLLAAVAIDDPAVLADYTRWTQRLLARYGIPPEHLREALRAVGDAVAELAPDAAPPAGRVLAEAEAVLA